MIGMPTNVKNSKSEPGQSTQSADSKEQNSLPEARKKGRKALILKILSRKPKPKSPAASNPEKPEEVRPRKTRINPAILSILTDVGIAAIIAVIVVGSVTAYSQNWPPLVVIESSSMMHGGDSSVGTIDTGDLTVVKHVNNKSEITTYVKGRAMGYTTYGDYGDVIIYSPPLAVRADPTPVIHRPFLWLEYNASSNSFDAPELAQLQYGVDWETSTGSCYGLKDYIVLKGIGYRCVDIKIDLNANHSLLKDAHSGFITLGDNNRGIYDQKVSTCRELVKSEWIVGKAQGEIPWFGLLKLYVEGSLNTNNPAPQTSVILLVTTILLVILLPIAVDVSIMLIEKKTQKKEAKKETSDCKKEKNIKNKTS